jgi:hypothetical protein
MGIIDFITGFLSQFLPILIGFLGTLFAWIPNTFV